MIDVTISGLTLQNGVESVGGAIRASNVNLVLSDMVIQNCNATSGGGGGLIFEGSNNPNLTISNTTFSTNAGAYGGGFYAGRIGDVSIANSTFSDNTAGSYGGGFVLWGGNSFTLSQTDVSRNTSLSEGGAASVWEVPVVSVQNCNVTGNTANGNGGGLYSGLVTSMNIARSVFTNNTSGGSGGAVYFNRMPQATFRNCTLSDNSAAVGGAMSVQNSNITLSSCQMKENSATNSGGALSFGAGGATADVDATTIAGNTASNYGGGIDISAGALTLTRSTLSDNTANIGGGLFVYSGQAFVQNTTVANCNALTGSGGGIYFIHSYGNEISLSTIAGNTSYATGGGLFANAQAAITVTNSVVAQNTLDPNAMNNVPVSGSDIDATNPNSVNVAFSLIQNANAAVLVDNGNNIFGVDPQLGTLSNHGGPTATFLPAVSSPLIAAGNSMGAPPTDQRGFARVSTSGAIDLGSVQNAPCGAIAEGASCDDGDPCTSNDMCTVGTCSGAVVADGTSCDDNNAATHGDACQAGICVGVVSGTTGGSGTSTGGGAGATTGGGTSTTGGGKGGQSAGSSTSSSGPVTKKSGCAAVPGSELSGFAALGALLRRLRRAKSL